MTLQALRFVLYIVLILPPGFFQMATPGRLQITSTPTGANITINGKAVDQVTNTTLVVSPGPYNVLVTGGPGNLNCQKNVQVVSGKTTVVNCP